MPSQPAPHPGTEACPLASARGQNSARGQSPAEHHSVFCPTCCSRLAESRCKLVCRMCGYFLSCADFY